MKSDLFNLAKRLGEKTPSLTQGTGGNISYKENSQLFIKPSGSRLDELTIESLAEVDIDAFTKAWTSVESEKDYSDLIKKASLNKHRASMETGFHVLLPKHWVIHFHSLLGILVAELLLKDPRETERFIKQNLKMKHCFLPFTLPGLELTNALKGFREVEVFFLANHGVVLNSDRSEIVDRWLEFEKIAADFFRFDFDAARKTKVGPLKIYLPDTVVFLNEIKQSLTPVGKDHFEFVNGDKNIRELWDASTLLYHLNPELSEIPNSSIKSILEMQTEKFRKGLLKVQSS